MSSEEEVRPRRAPATVKRTGAYWVLVPDASVDVAVVNAMGHHVFQQCDGSRSTTSIAQEISDVTGADVMIVRSDVDAFLTRLESAGLVIR